MESGATQFIEDANVLRLQQLQDSAGNAFTAHVTRHKADIAERHSFFQDKFVILHKTVLDDQQEAPSPTIEEPDTRSFRAPDPKAKRRELWQDDRHPRKLRRRQMIKRNPRTTMQTQSNKRSPDVMMKSPVQRQKLQDNNVAKEMKVLAEIEKFENMMERLEAAPDPLIIPAAEPSIGSVSANPPPIEERKSDALSFKNLFNMSPQFRDIETDDDKT